MAMSAFALDAVSGAPAYSGQMLRGALSALLGAPPAGRPLGATSGVRPGTPSATVSASGMTVTVAPHAGVLDVQADATTGPYLYAVTAAETVALNAAHATYTRWDRISVQLSDPAAGDGTSVPGVAIVYTPGTPSAAPAMPAEPARSLTLARIVVPQSGGGSPSVVWAAPECDPGARWYATEADRTRAHPSPATGTIAVIGSGAAMMVTVWDGTAWRTLCRSITGASDAAFFFTPASGISVSSFAAEISGGAITWQMSLSGLPAISAGPNNITVGNVASAFRPRQSFATWQGWAPGLASLITGLCAAPGDISIRWSAAAVAAGATGVILAGSWPVPV